MHARHGSSAVATATPRWRCDQDMLLRMAGYEDRQRAGFFTNSQIEAPLPLLRSRRRSSPTRASTSSRSASAGAPSSSAPSAVRPRRRARRLAARRDRLPRHHDVHRAPVPEPRRPAHRRASACAPTIQRVHVGDTGCASAMVALQQACEPRPRVSRVTARWWSRWRSAPPPTTSTTGWRARWPTRSSPTGRARSRCRRRRRRAAPSSSTARCSAPSTCPPWDSSIPAGGRAWSSPRRCGASAADMMKEMADTLMATQGLKRTDVRHFVLHSAGRRVIEQARQLMELAEDDVAAVPPRAARVRQHVLGHGRLRARRGAAERAGPRRRTGG